MSNVTAGIIILGVVSSILCFLSAIDGIYDAYKLKQVKKRLNAMKIYMRN